MATPRGMGRIPVPVVCRDGWFLLGSALDAGLVAVVNSLRPHSTVVQRNPELATDSTPHGSFAHCSARHADADVGCAAFRRGSCIRMGVASSWSLSGHLVALGASIGTQCEMASGNA